MVELPPWTIVAYPSALLFHFNVDIAGSYFIPYSYFFIRLIIFVDFQFVTSDGDARPTPENSTPIIPGDEEGRGSIVFFNQASMYRASELNGLSVADARRMGISATTDYGQDVQKAFENGAVRTAFRPEM